MGQEFANGASVGERMDRDRLEERGETSLACAVPPHLRNHRLGGVKACPGSYRCREKRAGVAFAAIDRNQKTSVKNHSP